MGGGGEWEEVAEGQDAEGEVVYEEEGEAEPQQVDEEQRPGGYRGARPSGGRMDKSVLAMLSGLGFFVVALLLVLGVWSLAATVPAQAPAFTSVVVLGMVLAVIIQYLWMLDDLRIRPRSLRKSHARFIAGPLIGVLAIVLFGLFTLAATNLFLIILSVVVLAVTQSSVALFLYSMLWEE